MRWIDVTLGQKIKALREKHGFTREDFAKRLGVSYWALSKYETDDRKPDYVTLSKIAYFFGVRTDYLLGHTEDNIYQRPITLGEIINRISNNHLLNNSQRQQLINKVESLVPLDIPYMIFKNNTFVDKDIFIKKSNLKELGINTIKDLDNVFETLFFEDNPDLHPEAVQKRHDMSRIENLTGDKLSDWVKLIEEANQLDISPQELMPVLQIIHLSKKEK